MKKSTVIMFFYAVLILCVISCLLCLQPYYTNIQASTLTQEEQLVQLQQSSENLLTQIDSLSSRLAVYDKNINQLEKRISELEEQNASKQEFLIAYYIDKLKDPTYVSIYNNDHTYYIAAENLGLLGKSAIPALINRLDTKDDYERALVLYALLLASQEDNVKCFCGSDYIKTSLDFDARNHPAQVQTALNWWSKYQRNFK